LQAELDLIERDMPGLEKNPTSLAQNLFTALRFELQQQILRETNGKIEDRPHILTLA
jgi:hypothetical protein